MNRRQMLTGSTAFAISNVAAGGAMSNSAGKLFVPAEEERHERTFMQWPVNRSVHPDRGFLELLQQTIADIANTISEFEPVIVLAAAQDHKRARRLLSSAVDLWDLPTDDLWCRDSGPLFAKSSVGGLVVSHIKFNGWGNKQVHHRDGKIAQHVAERLGLPLIESGLQGEAGGVEHDGHGLLLAHESSWVNANRNPSLSRSQVETRLLRAYGAEQLVWSPGVWDEDITDYHIDSLARFTGPGRVLINLPSEPDTNDPFHLAALDTHDALVKAKLKVDIISEPHPRRRRQQISNIDFVASYANYYVCNGGVIAAQFGDQKADQMAVDALKRHYEGREIITLNVDALGEVGGGIHCATQQMPAL